MRIIFLQPRVVELTVDRRDARVTLFASQHAVAEHQYLGLPDREIPALPAKPFLDVTEICSGRIGTGVAGPMAAALSSTPHARPRLGVEDARFAAPVRVRWAARRVGKGWGSTCRSGWGPYLSKQK